MDLNTFVVVPPAGEARPLGPRPPTGVSRVLLGPGSELPEAGHRGPPGPGRGQQRGGGERGDGQGRTPRWDHDDEGWGSQGTSRAIRDTQRTIPIISPCSDPAIINMV